MYTLDEPTVKELEIIIQELPLKYGLPILNILQTKLIRQELPSEEIKKDKK